MAFDVARHQMVLFGGDSLGPSFFGDTWAWDGRFWTQLADTGPSPRADHHVAFDAARSRLVLFGGRIDATVVNRDTWEWDGQYWTQVADTGPDPRAGLRLAFDDQRSRVVLFGGEATSAALRQDTWEWDGSTWTQVADTGPSARHQHAMSFDSVRKRVVLFGGDTGGATIGDTWEWDGANWTQVADTGPDPCAGAAMTFDGSGALLIGGIDSLSTSTPRLFSLTWEWDGQHWTTRQDIGPAPRWGHALAFDSDRVRPVLFGGLGVAASDPSAATHLFGDTWETSVGAVAPTQQVHLTAFQLNPDTVRVLPDKTSPTNAITVTIGLDRAAPPGTTVNFGVQGTPPGSLTPLPIPEGQTIAQIPLPFPFPGIVPGDFVFEATLGTDTLTATLHVTA
jgi:hypothetical protein